MNIPCDFPSLLLMLLMLVVPFLENIQLYFMRKKGSFPKKGYETITDVEDFIKNKKIGLAIKNGVKKWGQSKIN